MSKISVKDIQGGVVREEGLHSPNVTHSCQNMTKAPRTRAGANSDEKIGTVAFLAPIPIPNTNRTAKRACQE